MIGDSISIHYGPYLREMIKDKFSYDRKRGVEHALVDLDKPVGANAGDSSMVLEYLQEERDLGRRYDTLAINCGMHDLRRDRESNRVQIEIDKYKSNLEEIVKISKEISNEVIWISLTPIIDEIHNRRKAGVLRYSSEVEKYNEVSTLVMKEDNVKIIDLYNFTKNLGGDIYCDHVHFKDEVRRLQGAFIAGYLNSIQKLEVKIC
ncbi:MULTISPECIES: SGNH/GDSL hydrolase family protein [unclassified Clostridium]|uniref:SGNH/GDSL hydrolase family protein n=1 Tax=unclassified Clostridium TaxID=2614128 RepID=UPI0025C0C2B4|nr:MULTISPECIES: SGNH/GDSL hydrolase family protein [unclassified Clostridium]